MFAETVMFAKEAERQCEVAAVERGPFDGADMDDESDPVG